MKIDGDRPVTFNGGRHAFLLENEGEISGRVVLRPLTRRDLIGADWSRPPKVLRVIARPPSRDTWQQLCRPMADVCEGDGMVACACSCEHCEDHELECSGCDGCLGRGGLGAR